MSSSAESDIVETPTDEKKTSEIGLDQEYDVQDDELQIDDEDELLLEQEQDQDPPDDPIPSTARLELFSERIQNSNNIAIGSSYTQSDVRRWRNVDKSFIAVGPPVGNQEIIFAASNPNLFGGDWTVPDYWQNQVLQTLNEKQKKFDALWINIYQWDKIPQSVLQGIFETANQILRPNGTIRLLGFFKGFEEEPFAQEKIDRILLRVPKGKKAVIQEYATANGESVNAFLNRIIEQAMTQNK